MCCVCFSNANKGIDVSHPDFNGHGSFGHDTVKDGTPTGIYPNGHGTHVASIAVGQLYGLAKRARVVSVRMLNAQGIGSFE